MNHILTLAATVSLLAIHSTGIAKNISDPNDSASQDITNIYASYDNTDIYLSATFEPTTLSRGSLGMLFGLDTDLDIGTGVSNTATFPVGADYSLFFNAASASLAQRFSISKVGTAGTLAFISPIFVESEVHLTVARSLVNNIDIFNFGLAAGNATTPTSFTPTDFAAKVLSGPSDFGTPSWAVSSVPENNTTMLALFGLGVLAAVLTKRRGLTIRST